MDGTKTPEKSELVSRKRKRNEKSEDTPVRNAPYRECKFRSRMFDKRTWGMPPLSPSASSESSYSWSPVAHQKEHSNEDEKDENGNDDDEDAKDEDTNDEDEDATTSEDEDRFLKHLYESNKKRRKEELSAIYKMADSLRTRVEQIKSQMGNDAILFKCLKRRERRRRINNRKTSESD